MSPSVLIIDDHPLVRDGVKRSFLAAGFVHVSEAGSLKEAIPMIALHNPDVITVDINLPDGNGLEIVTWARKHSKTVTIIVLTLSDDLNLIAAASAAGAQAFISKSASANQLITAIHAARENPAIFISEQNVALLARDKMLGLLSQRELTVLSYLESELSAAEIAQQMFISHATVKTHISAIYRKLDSHTRRSAVARARVIGLL
ncbi:MAG: response regulator [Candidatus Planktophila sp.]